MVGALELDERPQTLGEEIANSVSHGIGLLAAVLAFPVLISTALHRGDLAGTVGATVFATTMVLLYLASTLFHALPPNRAKRVFQILDHSKAFGGIRYTIFSTWVYLAMGWLVLIAIKPVWTLVPKWGLFWLVAGGIVYTAGTVFFMAERIRYFHFVWHLFVVAGTACHFFAVLWYSA
jgi:hemolysin III